MPSIRLSSYNQTFFKLAFTFVVIPAYFISFKQETDNFLTLIRNDVRMGNQRRSYLVLIDNNAIQGSTRSCDLGIYYIICKCIFQINVSTTFRSDYS